MRLSLLMSDDEVEQLRNVLVDISVTSCQIALLTSWAGRLTTLLCARLILLSSFVPLPRHKG